ncbi:hypothetical protein G4B88_009412 [Cannabis sativa]|uniref:CCHC-type domain-containing protein n=1 Tax=Cannabis sativa TaxID=3483 RepID=A0A7J6GGZ5_CANSA|nr:hypothetical protein G4B88_009412 [Cannabis sativa]
MLVVVFLCPCSLVLSFLCAFSSFCCLGCGVLLVCGVGVGRRVEGFGEEASVKISPCASSQQALSTFCLLGKVVAPMLGFLSTENRTWALEHGPWCVRGYTFILKAWAPRKEHFDVFEYVRIWLHIYNLPRDYFSIVNGKTLGAKAGKVITVDLDEGNPALWKKSLKVLISLNVNLPLFFGCYFALESGVERWVQFKYEKLGIFCYNCGKLGHQRRGCSLTSPVSVSSENGVPFPLFGPWLSMDSSYLDDFSGANSFTPASSLAAQPCVSVTESLDDGDGAELAGRRSGSQQGVPQTTVLERVGKRKVFFERAVGPAHSSNGPVSKLDIFKDGASSGGPFNRCNVSNLSLHGTKPTLQNQNTVLPLIKVRGPCDNIWPGGLPGFKENNIASCERPTKTISIESSTCGQEVNFHHDESLALSNFFQAQDTLIHELEKFGNLNLYEIKAISGDIGVPTASEVNERTTPFKKRKFDGASASLCSWPWKLPLHHPGVVRDFPWDSDAKVIATNDMEEEPTEDASLSNSDFLGSDEWCSKD